MKQKFKELVYLDLNAKSCGLDLRPKYQSLLKSVWSLILLSGALTACSSSSYLPAEVDKSNHQRVLALAAEVQSEYPVAQISPKELSRLAAKDQVVIVDSRSAREQEVSMIPNAISIDDFKKLERLRQGRQVVVYCTIGVRSSEFIQVLSLLDIEAKNLHGGLLNWIHSGQELVDSQGEKTRNVHVYGRRWKLLPTGYLSEM